MSWTAETNIKGPKGDTGGIGEAPTDGQTYGRKNSAWNIVVSGGGAASSITFTPAGNIAATNVQAAIAEVDTEKVAKAGDTMTGNLQINKANPSLVLQKLAAGQANQLAGYNGANPRWSLALGDSSTEAGSNAGSNFALYRYTDAGGLIDTPLTIARVDGGVTLTGALLLAADPGTALGAATKQYVDNNIRAPATVAPIIDGVAAVGVATKYAREDHVHPSDVAARAVRYDIAQGLTAPQQGQAQTNISAVSYAAQTLTAPQQLQARTNIGASPIVVVRTQSFVASGTYVPNANMVYCMVECQGAGGGGGCGQSISGWVTGGGGGGSGVLARSYLTRAQIGASQAITIGASGAAGNPGNGGNGGTTTVGALLSAPGGGGGGASSGGSGGGGGTGGSGGAGDITLSGKHGFCGGGAPSTQGSFGGHGADSLYGYGAVGPFSTGGAFNASSGFLGGGGAGGVAYNAVAGAGGLGGGGHVVITEYCSA